MAGDGRGNVERIRIEKKMKPVLYLDPEMPRTHMIPADDSLYNTYLDLCYDYQFADPEYPERAEAGLKAIRDFQNANPFKEAKLVKQQTLLFGRGAVFRGYGNFSDKTCYPGTDKGESDYTQVFKSRHPVPPPEKSYVTHPDNILGWTAEERDKFEIVPMKTFAEYMKEWGLS